MTKESGTLLISDRGISATAAQQEAGPQDPSSTVADHCRRALDHWGAGRLDAASNAIWTAYALDPHDRPTKKLLAKFLHGCPTHVGADRRAAYLSLLQDQEVEPDEISSAGWQIALSDGLDVDPADDRQFQVLSARLNTNEL